MIVIIWYAHASIAMHFTCSKALLVHDVWMWCTHKTNFSLSCIDCHCVIIMFHFLVQKSIRRRCSLCGYTFFQHIMIVCFSFHFDFSVCFLSCCVCFRHKIDIWIIGKCERTLNETNAIAEKVPIEWIYLRIVSIFHFRLVGVHRKMVNDFFFLLFTDSQLRQEWWSNGMKQDGWNHDENEEKHR